MAYHNNTRPDSHRPSPAFPTNLPVQLSMLRQRYAQYLIFLILISFPVYFTLRSSPHLLPFTSQPTTATSALRNLRLSFRHSPRCISSTERDGTAEGLGSFLQRSQLIIFLADIFDAEVSFPKKYSTHGYDIASFFSNCSRIPNAKHQPFPSSCVLDQERMFINQCNRGDCLCLANETLKQVHSTSKHCPLLKVKVDRMITMQYSGCIKNTMSNYFATGTPPSFAYDAVHYRQGDLKDTTNLKSFSPHTLNDIVNIMCVMSDRPIVIVTEGSPNLPQCQHRIILAANLSIRESFRIFQYAHTVGIGISSFARAMMQIASPNRVVLVQKAFYWYDWVPCQNWTIIGDKGLAYHFNDKEILKQAVLQHGDLSSRVFSVNSIRQKDYNMSLPTRRWTDVQFEKEQHEK